MIILNVLMHTKRTITTTKIRYKQLPIAKKKKYTS